MNLVFSSFLLTTLAGLATLIGYFIIYVKGNKNKIISFSLALASGVMLTISVIDLIPSSYIYLSNYQLFLRLLLMIFFFLLGHFLSSYLAFFVDKTSGNSLEKVGIITMLAIVFHNIPEGIITFMVSGVNFKLGIKLAIAISMHNIPEGISIAIPYYYATKRKRKTFLLVLISSLSEIFGAFIAYIFLKKYLTNFLIGSCFSMIAGIMINISINELLKEAIGYKLKKIIILGFITGSFLMIISHFSI